MFPFLQILLLLKPLVTNAVTSADVYHLRNKNYIIKKLIVQFYPYPIFEPIHLFIFRLLPYLYHSLNSRDTEAPYISPLSIYPIITTFFSNTQRFRPDKKQIDTYFELGLYFHHVISLYRSFFPIFPAFSPFQSLRNRFQNRFSRTEPKLTSNRSDLNNSQIKQFISLISAQNGRQLRSF